MFCLTEYVERSSERHWVHKSADDRESFKKAMRDKFRLDEAVIENKITVDATSFDKMDYEGLLETAKKFL